MSIEDISQSIQVRHVMAQLLPEGTVDALMPQTRAKKLLSEHDFDFGVVEKDGKPVGIVEGAALGDSETPVEISTGYCKLDLDHVVPEVTPISDLISYLAVFPFQVVVRGKEVIALVHISDLNKHPVYSYFYLLISRLEQCLLRLILERFPQTEQWEPLLKRLNSWSRIENRWKQAVKGLRQLPAIYYADFGDYLALIRSSTETLSELGFSSDGAWEDHTKGMKELRNDVMHSVRDLIGEHRTVRQLDSTQKRVMELDTKADALARHVCSAPPSKEKWVEMS